MPLALRHQFSGPDLFFRFLWAHVMTHSCWFDSSTEYSHKNLKKRSGPLNLWHNAKGKEPPNQWEKTFKNHGFFDQQWWALGLTSSTFVQCFCLLKQVCAILRYEIFLFPLKVMVVLPLTGLLAHSCNVVHSFQPVLPQVK